jgi:hypothetical protein
MFHKEVRRLASIRLYELDAALQAQSRSVGTITRA